MRKLLIIIFCFTAIFANAQSGYDKNDVKIVKSLFEEELVNGESYERLRSLCKDIGPRLTGSEGAAKSVEWSVEQMRSLGFDTVYLQACKVPVWKRGEPEFAAFHSKKFGKKELNVCALGYSLSTPPKGIKANILMVNGIEDIEKLPASDVKGKIVFYNRPMDAGNVETFHAYGGCVDQRSVGAITAEKKGAIGSIVRSMGLRNDDYPHTGTISYNGERATIPAIAVSTNGANELEKMIAQDPNVQLEMIVNSYMEEDALSYNVIGEKFGSVYKEQYILISGHLDSWDLGEGAHDDGAGIIQSIETVNLFNKLKINNKHTLRVVLFMNEENGTRGARKYAKETKAKNDVHLCAIESDSGGFVPRGFNVDAAEKSSVNLILQQIKSWEMLLEPYNLHRYKAGYSGVDINFLKDQKIPLIGFYPDPQRYFDIHHTALDVFENVNKRELELGVASIAALVYLVDKYGITAKPIK